MDTISLNNLLVFLRGLSFNDREWLASRLFDDEIRENLRRSFRELKDYKAGKVEFQPADELLKELRAI